MADSKPNYDHDLEELVRQFQATDLNELHVRTDAFELYLSRDPDGSAPWTSAPARASQPAFAAKETSSPPPLPAAPTPAPAQTAAVEIPEGFTVVRAPYLGTFYRAPKPGEPDFVELGQTVEAGTDLCLVEVMKLFTAVRAEAKGIVRHVYAVDGQMVEEGAPLFGLEPVT